MRARSQLLRSLDEVASGTGSKTTAGHAAARAWLRRTSLSVPGLLAWHAQITLGIEDAPPALEIDERDTRLRIEIYSEEWGFFFCRLGRASWIRVTDAAFVHGRDDFGLLARAPALDHFGAFVLDLEQHHGIVFRRDHALIRTNIPSAEPAIRLWVRSL